MSVVKNGFPVPPARMTTRPCSRCNSLDPQDGRRFFTAKTYHVVHVLGVFCRSYGLAAVERYIAKVGHLVLCAACWRKLQANGSWAAVLEARLESRKEQTHA